MSPAPSRWAGAAWSLPAWALALLLLGLPGTRSGAWAFAAAAMTLVALALVVVAQLRRAAWALDGALAAALVMAALRDPALAGTGLPTGVAGLVALGLAHTLSRWALAASRAPLAPLALRSGGVLALAGVLAYVVASLPAWSAGFVSSRWAASIDTGSAAALAILGLTVCCLVAAWTAARLALRRPEAAASSATEPEAVADT